MVQGKKDVWGKMTIMDHAGSQSVIFHPRGERGEREETGERRATTSHRRKVISHLSLAFLTGKVCNCLLKWSKH